MGERVTFLNINAYMRLDHACHKINEAFEPGYGCYLVGSALTKPDYRDVDVRYIMGDEQYDAFFPATGVDRLSPAYNARWTVICMALSEVLTRESGLPVDFQIQKMSRANEKFKGEQRHPLGILYGRDGDDA